jgi:Skp family chaperone for outer membrane proteins
MKRRTQTTIFGMAALLSLLCMVIGYQASAMRSMAARPTAVAVIDLAEVLQNLNERAAAESKLKAMRDSLQTERQEKADEIEALGETIEALRSQINALEAAGDPVPAALRDEFQRTRDEGNLKAVNFEMWTRYSANRLDIEEALLMQDLFRKIQVEAAAMAQVDGWDVIFLDDSKNVIQVSADSKVARVVQVQQQILRQRVLYAHESVSADITEQLIDRMNNAWMAGGS